MMNMLKKSSLASLLFLAIMGTVNAEVTTINTETNETLMPQGQWKDLNTGLIWQRCSIGQTWNGNTCDGDAKIFRYVEDIPISEEDKANGWRLPTIDELVSIRNCSKGEDEDIREISAKNTHSGKDVRLHEECKRDSAKPTIDSKIFPRTVSYLYMSGSRGFQKSSAYTFMGFANGNMGVPYRYFLSFSDGYIKFDSGRRYSGHVRLVRDK